MDDDVYLPFDGPGKGNEPFAVKPQLRLIDRSRVIFGHAPPIQVADGGIDRRAG